MANFQEYYDRLLKPFEGGYNLIKQDRGGETYKGIARNENPNWEGWKTVDAWKARKGGKLPYNFIIPDSNLDKLVLQLFKVKYWDKLKADFIKNQSLAEILVDWYINGGLKIKPIQTYLKITADGLMGQQTLNAINNTTNPAGLFEYIKDLRKKHYEKIIEDDPSQEIFKDGWTNRINSFFFQ